MDRDKQINELVDETMILLEQPSKRKAPVGFAELVTAGKRRRVSVASYWQVAAMIAFIVMNAFTFSVIQDDEEVESSTSAEAFINQYNLEGPTYTW